VRRQGAAKLRRVRPPSADQRKGGCNMSRSQIDQLRRVARNLSRLGIPFEVVAFLVAQHMRQNGIPITPENLDAAFF